MTIEELQATYAVLKKQSEDYKAQVLELTGLVDPVKPAYFVSSEDFNTYAESKSAYDSRYRELKDSTSALEKQIAATRKTMADQITIERTWFKIAEPDVWVSNNGLHSVGDTLAFFNTEDPSTLPVYDIINE
jgi:chromosome segregation ATPase